MTSAALPFGMVKLSPDTVLVRLRKCGYQNAEPDVYGFSHLHEWKLCGLPVMPISGSVDPLSGPEGWKSPFDKQHQTVAPGYHRLTLTRYGIDAELTATMRVGMHRYTFNNSGNAEILVPLSGQWVGSTMRGCNVKRSAPDTIEGSVLTGRTLSAKQSFYTKVFFVIQADRPFDSLDGWKGKQLLKSIGDLQGNPKGGDCGLILNFGMIKGGTPIQLKVAISYCSVEGAHLNLKTELPGWDFAAVHAAARDTWNRTLGRIEVTGSHDLEVKFYNGLWHALLGRGIFSDVDGHYPITAGEGNIKQIKCVPLDSQGKPLFAMHNSDSFWWSQNNLNSVWGLAYPDVLRDFCLSWLRYYDDVGELPLGSIPGRVMPVMPGAQAAPLLARAIQMNLSGVDAEHAYEAMKSQQTHDNWAMGKATVFDQYGGWMPANLDDWSVTHTVEDGWCDWVLSEVAKKLGKADDAVYFRRLSTGWTHLYNEQSGWLQPRNSNGSWLKPFDVNLMESTTHYKESWPAVLTWFPAKYDIDDTINVMGGREKAIQRLNEQFEKAAPQGFHAGWMEYDNEPGFDTAHLFIPLGDQIKAQHWVREVFDANYRSISTAPVAYAGGGSEAPMKPAGNLEHLQVGLANPDDDEGQMGALADMMMMGLFQLRGGCETNPGYEITSPMFEKVVVHLQPDCYRAKEFVITAHPDPEKNPYVRLLKLNDKPLSAFHLSQEDISNGVHLDVTLTNQPNAQ